MTMANPSETTTTRFTPPPGITACRGKAMFGECNTCARKCSQSHDCVYPDIRRGICLNYLTNREDLYEHEK